MPHGSLVRKAAIFLPSRPTEHLHVVMNDPVFHLDSEKVLAVCLCSVKPNAWHDPACILQKGDHRVIQHDTYVDYRTAAVRNVPRLNAGLAAGEVRLDDPFVEAVFARIRLGFNQSHFAVPKMLRFLEMHGF